MDQNDTYPVQGKEFAGYIADTLGGQETLLEMCLGCIEDAEPQAYIT